ncbi:hypothetical protein SAMN05428961_10960 [Paenibacillus sp. OK060]|nr:hypothetical protein SAMN05428961_10960 [Paenibacillus sp. OK060]SLK18173.1 hypothetical protein SAMN06272722_11261 [Paenibacillus sp. RU5A]SOC75077.1 hypothetical protein SAMN05880581_11261 [Paenibacillus sp. RU26A]SOC77159.1 hypothetical protein SAMN05880586_11261 [Paenibacillus sp. RU5M]
MDERSFFTWMMAIPKLGRTKKATFSPVERRLPVQYRYSFVVVKSHSCNGTTFVFLINL